MHRRSALNRVRMLFVISAAMTILWSVGTIRTVVGQGGDCSPLVGGDLGDLDSLNRTGLISASLSSQPELKLLDYHIVCVAQGTERNTWRMVSGVATFMMEGGMNSTVQFHFQCENDGSAWNTTVLDSTEHVLTTPNATFDTPLRTDCALCVSPEQQPDADNDQHCVSCASECNVTGLMRCTSPASTDCCTLYGPGGQCVNDSSCPGNSVANEAFECTCPSNYTGVECTMDVNECEMATNPCENGANCTNTNGGFTCDCPPGFTGSLCDMNVTVTVTSECDLLSDPCMNGGTCMNISGSVMCLCSSGYTGATCEENIDVCLPNPCQNGGECMNGSVAEFTCNCTADWNGTLCEVCTLKNCANCTANENQSFAAVCVQCEDGYQLENETCERVCQVEGCVNCSESSSFICEECDSGLMIAQDGSSCSASTTTPPSPSSTSVMMTTGTAASSENDTGRLAGIVAGSVVGGLLLILLVVVILIAIVHWWRKKSRVTLTFDFDSIKASHVTANPVFEESRREDSGIENDDEIVVNPGALEF